MKQFKSLLVSNIIGMNIKEAELYMHNLIIKHNIEYPYKIKIIDVKLNNEEDICFYRLNVTINNEGIIKDIIGWY